MYKLSYQPGDDWIEHSHPAVFRIEVTDRGTERLVAGVPVGSTDPFARLVACLDPPYFLLYVLHTPRGEGPAGRYQSPPIDADEFRAFVDRHAVFLSGDSRFDIWAHSPADNATVVWDRHNLIYVYGPLGRFASALRGLGFVEGEASVSFAHQHHYRAEPDQQAADVLSDFEWRYSPLRPEDEQ